MKSKKKYKMRGGMKVGIRIHRCMGYALTDVKYRNYRIIDKRFDLERLEIIEDHRYDKNIKKEYINFAGEFIEKENHFELSRDIERKIHYASCVKPLQDFEIIKYEDFYIWQSEYGLSNVFLIRPLTKRVDWERYDDNIDYYMEFGKGARNYVKYLDTPIYPECWWCDTRTGEIITSAKDEKEKYAAFEFYKMYRFRKYDKKRKELFKGQEQLDFLDKCVKAFGCDTVKDADKYMQPYVEFEVQIMSKFLNIFKDEKTVFQMKPVIYTYWS